MPSASDDVEKQVLQDTAKYSFQAQSKKAPWETGGTPAVGPGVSDTIYGLGANGLSINMIASQADEAPRWGFYPLQRDRYLRRLWKAEGIMAGGTYNMVARLGALPYKIEGLPRAKKKAQDLLHNFDVKRWALDFLTTDNGAFIERLGPGRPDKALPKNLIRGLAVMDSGQCWRSFDPEFPVIYVNPYTGKYHKIHYSRVIMSSSMPQPEELARGIGFCAVSRALLYIQIMRDIAIYKHEKVSGRFTRAIMLAKGFANKSLAQSLSAEDVKTETLGFTRYKGIPMLATMDQTASLEIIDLASIPDGFNVAQDIPIYVNCLALAFGTDAREFWPVASGGLNSGKEASVQHQKSQGKGMADMISTLERDLNWGGLPDNASMEYDFTDDEQDLMVATLHTAHITNVGLLQSQGNITAMQGTAILVSKGVIDPTVLSLTAAENSEPLDDAAPEDEQDEADPAEITPPPVQPAAAPGTQPGQPVAPSQPGQGPAPVIVRPAPKPPPPTPDQVAGFAPGAKPTKPGAKPASKAAKPPEFSKQEIAALFAHVKAMPTLKKLRQGGDDA